MDAFKELGIKGVYLAKAQRFEDKRGWLMETFRADWLKRPELAAASPAMAYVSLTHPGVTRGPHEHLDQTDHLGFIGPSDFRVFLWDNRDGSPTFGRRIVLVLGESEPGMVIVPPRVVHAYKNIGDRDGLVMNYPNRLFAGEDKRSPVDEVRHEDEPDSRFQLDV